MGAKDVRTPSARLLLKQFEDEAKHWDDVTTGDGGYAAIQRAEARRDAIDWARQQLVTALPEVEDEAVDIEVSETARMQAVLDAYDAEPLTVWS